MRCLIDTDLLAYECSFAGQYKDESTGEVKAKDFEDVIEVFEQKVGEIEDECASTEASLFFLTGDEGLLKHVNRDRKRAGEPPLDFKPNFRFEVAKSTPYKKRKSNKPYHFHNLRAWLYQNKEVHIAWGMEADDALCIYQNSRLPLSDTIICSRDKDLRMMEGWQYGWECGAQASFGPKHVSYIGEISLPKPNKLVGEGIKFFYAQLITGDSVDTIPGLPRGGPALAYKTLSECETEEEMYEKVSTLYEKKIGEGWENYLMEQCGLLWMVRELDGEGNPVLFVQPRRR